MKIYCNRRNDMTTYNTLEKFCGKDLWIKVLRIDGPSPFSVWHKIHSINDLQIIEFSEVLDSDYPLSELQRDMKDRFREGYNNYIKEYRIPRPLEVYTVDDLKELLGN